MHICTFGKSFKRDFLVTNCLKLFMHIALFGFYIPYMKGVENNCLVGWLVTIYAHCTFLLYIFKRFVTSCVLYVGCTYKSHIHILNNY